METPVNFFSLISFFESESTYESLSKSKFENSLENVTEKRMLKKAVFRLMELLVQYYFRTCFLKICSFDCSVGKASCLHFAKSLRRKQKHN